MKINIGSGLKRYEGYSNVDCDPLVVPDYVVNLDDVNIVLPFESSTVTNIKAYHIFEHIGEGFIPLFKELYRVAENGCILDIKVPHHRSDIFYGDPTHIRPITLEALNQFDQSFNKWEAEKWGSHSGLGIRFDINWRIVEFEFIIDDYWKERFKKAKQEDIYEVSRNFNNVYSETHIKMVAMK